jgi:aspartate/methionine/tyrosine aminotransferase
LDCPLREAIAGHYRDQYRVDVAPERIVVTAGSSAALLLALALLVDRDEPSCSPIRHP